MTQSSEDPSSPVTQSGLLKITEAELQYLQNFLDFGDRGGYYMALYNMTGNAQCLEQAQIATFSEGLGGTAYYANRVLQDNFGATEYPGVYYLSQQVALQSLRAIRAKLDENVSAGNESTGYITVNEMFQSADQAWLNNGVQRLFPGNFLDSMARLTGFFEQELALPPIAGAQGVTDAKLVEAINAGINEGNLSSVSFTNRLLSDGTLAAVLGGLGGGPAAGKRLADYMGKPEEYEIRALPDSTYNVAISKHSGKVVGVFNNQAWPSLAEFMNRLASNWPAIVAAVVNPALGLTVTFVQSFIRSYLEDFHRSLSEDAVGFNGDVNPRVPTTFSGSPAYPITDTPGAANDTRWGTGGALSVLYSDTLHGGAGSDRMFGGDGDDELHGDEANDVVYGQSDDDRLYGGQGEDTLRGGEGDDTLYGGEGNDILDGDDLDPNSSGNDSLRGQDGNDSLAGGKGNDTLEGDAGNDVLYGGDGEDEIKGGSAEDHLEGNAADDTLDGGAGNDSLIGGAGRDTYKFTNGSGHDVVVDSDGDGVIDIAGIGVLDGQNAKKIAPNAWQTSDRSVNYTLVKVDDNRSDLYITFSDRNDVITIRNWTEEKNLGITLEQAVAAVSIPTTEQTITLIGVNDREVVVNGGGVPDSYTIIGTTSGNQIIGGDVADVLIGNGGGDGLYGAGGDDLVYATGILTTQAAIEAAQQEAPAPTFGSVLEGNLGNDLLIGSESNFMYGGAARDTLIGGSYVDYIYGDTFDGGYREDSGDVFRPTFHYNATTGKYTFYIEREHWGLTTYYGRFGDLDVDGSDDVIYAGAGGDLVDGELGNDNIILGAGDDVGVGREGNDTVIGEGGTDLLFGDFNHDASAVNTSLPEYMQWNYAGTDAQFHGGDLLSGGAGEDTIWGNGGADTISGGDDNDLIKGDDRITAGQRHGDDVIDGGGGNDDIEGGGKHDTIRGGEGNDFVFGDDNKLDGEHHGKDVMYGDGGNDALVGGGSSDIIEGGSGNDILFGDNRDEDALDETYQGSDSLNGGSGVDTLSGGGGNDVLDGGADDDEIYGDAGDDVIIGGSGADYLDGGAGNDTYVVSSGDSFLNAQGAADTIVDSAGSNRMVISDGSEGALWVTGNDQGQLVVEFGGNSRVIVEGGMFGSISNFSLGSGGSYSYTQLVGQFSTGPITAYGPDGKTYVLGGRGGDMINANGGGSLLSGGFGDDTITGGGGGNTYVFGRGDGHDSVTDAGTSSGTGAPVASSKLTFSEGVTVADIRLSFDGGLVLRVGSEGADSLRIDGVSAQSVQVAPNINSFEFADGTVLSYAQLIARGFDFQGSDAAETISGTSATDRINGGTGNDTLMGGLGADRYAFGLGSGADVIADGSDASGAVDALAVESGVSGGNLILNRVGDDLLVRIRDGVDQVTVVNHFAGAAIERIDFADGGSWDAAAIASRVSNELSDSADNFTGTAGNDVIDGRAGNDTLLGSGGNDMVDGNVGNDSLNGGAGNDSLFGGEGADNLNGSTGDDLLDGGAGNDLINAGSGNNTYLFGRGDGSDTVSAVSDSTSTKLNILQFKSGVAPGDVTVRQNSASMQVVFGIAGTTDTLAVAGFFNGEAAALNPLQQVRFADGTIWSWADVLARAFIGTDASESLQGTNGADTMIGGAGNDTLSGNGGNDVLDGGTGTDYLSGGDGDDTLIDGETMYGGAGNDSYVVNAWPTSTLTISEASGIDELVLPANSTPQSLSVDLAYSTSSQKSDALSLRLGNGSPIQIEGFFASQGADSIEQIRFADGTIWTRADIFARVPSARLSEANDQSVIGFVWADTLDGLGGNDSLYGRQGNDTLQGGAGQDSVYGDQGNDVVSGGSGDDLVLGDSEIYTATGDGNDQLSGGDGNDTLYGASGLDSLDGGAGADLIYGGDGDDTYQLSRASGDDSIYDSAGNDRIAFGADVQPGSFTLWRDGADLVIAVDQNALQTRVLSHFGSASTTLDSISFADGTVWDAAAIASRVVSGTANAMSGTAGNDTFVVDNVGDTISETLGGTDTVQSSVSWTLGANIENLNLTGFLHLRGTGNSLGNVLTGNSGNNVLDGMGGADTLVGGLGNDTYNVVASEDSVVESAGEGIDTIVTTTSYTLGSNVENLTLTPYAHTAVQATGNGLDNVITIQGSSTYGNVLNGGAGADTLVFNGYGGAVFHVDNAADTVLATGTGHSVISTLNWTLASNMANLQLKGSASIGVGNALNNVLIGTGQNGQLSGLAGDDTLYSDYNPSYNFPGTAVNTSWSSLGADTLMGGVGNDTYYVYWAGGVVDTVVENSGEGTDTVCISGETRTYSIADFANVENLRLQAGGDSSLVGDASANQLYGNTGSNLLDGGAGNDYIHDGGTGAVAAVDSDLLRGGDGNDQLLSWYGNDTLEGGTGNDSLSVAAQTTAARILFARGHGADTVSLAGTNFRSFDVDASLSISDLQVTRAQRDLVLSFGQGDSITITNYFADTTTTAASGLFTYLELADGLRLTEQMLITRMTSGNSNQATGAADLIFGSGAADSFNGLGGDDLILGAGGADSLRGGTGADTLGGGAGNDTFLFATGDGVDIVRESSGTDAIEFAAGIDPGSVTVSRTGTDLQLQLSGGTDRVTVEGFFGSAGAEIESVRFADGTVWTLAMLREMGNQYLGTSGADAFNGTEADEKFFGMAGNDLVSSAGGNDSLDGGDGNDTLNGGSGQDTIVGGLGNDTFDPGTGVDVIRFGRGAGVDRITGYDSTDEIRLDTGVAPSDLRFSYSGANLVIGIAGTSDSLTVDQFVNYWNQVSLRFDDGTTWSAAEIWQALTTINGTESAEVINGTASGDRIYANGGNDTVDGAGGNDLIEGGAGDDSLTGGAGYDSLNGGSGIDRMVGGTEDDTYVVDHTSDVVVEASGGGDYDYVESSVSYTLGNFVEALTLTGSGNTIATGNGLSNNLAGNAGNNTLVGGAGDDGLADFDGGNDSLDGGSGNDFMEAGAGNDTYVVDSALDEVYEYELEGNDLVQASVSYTLGDELERLTLTGSSGLSATGNALDNVLTGNSGANRIEALDGNDTLDGGTGTDTMLGGAGNDLYYVNVTTDVVTEVAGGGTDTVSSSVTLTLGANVENLTLTGTSNLGGTGNTLANMLIGNSGANSLTGGDGDDTMDGGAGNDTMVGGLGNDTFYINVSTDVVTEAASGGTDTVISLVTHTLGTQLENLTLAGTGAINGAGNASANVLVGNAAVNTLTGSSGNDTLDGAAGNDSLVGGTGADAYRFGTGYGIDTISENDTTAGIADAVQFVGTVTQANVQFSRVGNNLEVLLTGTSDKLVLQSWYLGTQYQVEEFRFTDGSVLTNSQAQARVTSGGSLLTTALTGTDQVAATVSASGTKRDHGIPRRATVDTATVPVAHAVERVVCAAPAVHRDAVPKQIESPSAGGLQVEPHLGRWLDVMGEAYQGYEQGTQRSGVGSREWLLPDVLDRSPASGPGNHAVLARQVAALVESMAAFNVPSAGTSSLPVNGIHVPLDKVTLPGLTV